MPMTRGATVKLPVDCSMEEFERACEFVRKVKEIDKERNHKGIYNRYITAMKLYHSGSLNTIDLKNRITTIFKNCDVLLADFDRILKGSDTDSRQDVVAADPSNVKQMRKFLKALRSVSENLREKFLEAFERFREHNEVQILKRKVNRVLHDYPCLKEEFRRILLNHGLIIQDGKKRDEITSDEEDKLLENNMYFHGIEAATKFAMAEDEENLRPPAGVYGAVRRFYEEYDMPYPQESMRDNPKLEVRRILPTLQEKYKSLLKDKRKSLEKVQKVNESLVVFDGNSPEALYETRGVLT